MRQGLLLFENNDIQLAKKEVFCTCIFVVKTTTLYYYKV